MAIDATKKSSRFLQSRRYTYEVLGDSQEAFTRVLDLNASEIYTQQNLIPSASLPFSQSGQNGYYYTAGGTISPTATGQDIMRYWYRQSLSPGLGNNQVWFFLNPFTASGASSPSIQIIQGGQQTNFISPKYIIPSLAGANAEAGGGYRALVFIDGAEVTDQTKYAFDYKTGVLQWTTAGDAPSISSNVQVTAYQYVGKTLADASTGGQSGSFSGSFEGSANISALRITGSAQLTGSLSLTGSLIVTGPVLSNGINVLDNAIAMSIALG